jgi:hypothetical protein
MTPLQKCQSLLKDHSFQISNEIVNGILDNIDREDQKNIDYWLDVKIELIKNK